MIPDLLRGILSESPDELLTTEDYARLAQMNDSFAENMFERMCEMTPDQACALFDLARKGLEAKP